MAWVKIDDQMPDHPKLSGLGDMAPLALALQLRALCYASRYLTDGFLPQGAISGLLGGFKAWGIEYATVGDPPIAGFGKNADEFDWPALMVGAGLWERQNGKTPGYQLHDYLGYNPPRERVLANRTANAQRQKDFRERNARSNAPRNALSNGAVTTPPTPTPTTKALLHAREELARFLGEHYAPSLAALGRANSGGVFATIRALGPGGIHQEFDWPVIGRAVFELANDPDPRFNAARFRGFCRRLVNGNGKTDSTAWERFMAGKDA